MTRPRMLLALTAIALGISAAVLLVFGGTPVQGPATSSPTHSPVPSATTTPAPLSGFPSCATTQMLLAGIYSDCASSRPALTPATCAVTGRTYDVVTHLYGAAHQFLLYITVDGAYTGPATLQLHPWPHPIIDAGDGIAKVAIRELTSGAFWQSTNGFLTIDGPQGRAGYVSADLAFVDGGPTPAERTLGIGGPWSC